MRACFLALAALLVSAPASADEIQGTRFDLVERTDDIALRFDRGEATLIVTRTVENLGPRSDQAVFYIEVPDGAVATRLRSAGNGTWYEGELLGAEEAAKRYEELTGYGAATPKDPALLSWLSPNQLRLLVFPVPPHGTKTIEYTLRMPARYEHGEWVLAMPQMGTTALPARMHVSAAHAEDHVIAGNVELLPATTMTVAKDVEIRLAPRNVPRLEGGLASIALDQNLSLVHAGAVLASRISEVPQGAAVVIAIDTSRTMESEFSSELAAARAYLAEFPGATAEVLTFDRKVQSPFGGPLPAAEAMRRLAGFTPIAANGSAIDDAIEAADAKLARSASNTRRMLVFGDLLTREALKPERITLKSGAVVHVATVTSGRPSLDRQDDDEAWSPLARRTGGLLWRASSEATVDAAARTTFSEWVRPRRIEKVHVTGLPAEFTQPEVLWEGDNLEFLGVGTKSSRVTIEGELWSKPFTWSMNETPAETKKWAAFAFATDVGLGLTPEEQLKLAKYGNVVSPVTSFLAIEPGVRPSLDGLKDVPPPHGFGGSASGIGLGSVGSMSHCGGLGTFDPKAELERELAKAAGQCTTAGVDVAAKIELTRDEIVQVSSVEVRRGAAREPSAEACITEQLWATMLSGAFRAEHALYPVRTQL